MFVSTIRDRRTVVFRGCFWEKRADKIWKIQPDTTTLTFLALVVFSIKTSEHFAP